MINLLMIKALTILAWRDGKSREKETVHKLFTWSKKRRRDDPAFSGKAV